MLKSDFRVLVAGDDHDYLFQTVFNGAKTDYKTIATGSSDFPALCYTDGSVGRTPHKI